MDTDVVWLARSIDLAVANVADGGGPFGAVVILGGRAVGEGANRVTDELDPTAHAEVRAIRAACRATGSFALTGATLYSSCEPCPMCLSAALWARVDRVVYAADRYAAERAGFDDAVFHGLLTSTDGAWPIAIEHVPVTGSGRPFEAWAAHEARVPY